MRMFVRRSFFLWIVLILILALPACRSNFRPPATSATRLAIIQATATDQISPSTQQVPTATVIPTLTTELTPTVTATVTFTPTPTEPPPVHFAVIGDYGEAGPSLQAVAEIVLGWEPDFILTTGDNNYPNGTAELIDENIGQYFHSYIYPYQGSYGPGAESNRFFPTLGNHDWNTASAQPYFDYFTLPGNERYYDFTWGPLHFFALNSDSREPDGVGKSSVQAAWLKEELEDSTLPWQIIYGHYPPFSSGYHGSTDWMYWPFTDWGADVVLSGHDHTYERLEVEGMLHFIVGLSGASRSTFSTPHPGSLVRYNSQYGALLVEATAEQITFSFYNITGELVDSYTLLAER